MNQSRKIIQLNLINHKSQNKMSHSFLYVQEERLGISGNVGINKEENVPRLTLIINRITLIKNESTDQVMTETMEVFFLSY